MRQKRNGSHLILMELMFVLFFFAICGAVLLQVFVKSHNISVKAKELTETKNCVTQAAELFETGYTDIEHYQEYFPKLEEDQGIYQGYFDKDWKMTQKKNAVYKRRSALMIKDQTEMEDNDIQGKEADISFGTFKTFARREK